MQLTIGGRSQMSFNQNPFPTQNVSTFSVTDGKKTDGGGGISLDDIESATGSIAGIWSNVKGVFSGGDSKQSTPEVVQSGTGGGAGDSLKRTFENLWNTAKTTVESAVRGGLEGAESASAGSVRGASFGSGVSNMNTTLLLGGALVVAVVLFMRK